MTIKKTVAIKRALVSVFDKSGLEILAKFLKSKGIEIISTGGSANALRKAKIPVTDISNITGFPEILDGRVKTLHPKIHGALLARRNLKKHKNILKNYKIDPDNFLQMACPKIIKGIKSLKEWINKNYVK